MMTRPTAELLVAAGVGWAAGKVVGAKHRYIGPVTGVAVWALSYVPGLPAPIAGVATLTSRLTGSAANVLLPGSTATSRGKGTADDPVVIDVK